MINPKFNFKRYNPKNIPELVDKIKNVISNKGVIELCFFSSASIRRQTNESYQRVNTRCKTTDP